MSKGKDSEGKDVKSTIVNIAVLVFGGPYVKTAWSQKKFALLSNINIVCAIPVRAKRSSQKKRVKQLEKRKKSRTSGLKRLRKVSSASRVESSNDVSLGAQEDASKQGRKISDLDVDAEMTLTDETQERYDEEMLFDIQDDLQGEEVVEKEISAPEKPLKKKDQIALDKELALRLHAEEQAELEKERVAQEEASRVANIKELDNIQAMIQADEKLAARLQAEEQE
ncbi:hypothetical protein Tco_0218699 [Tanacetum coccineum]